MKINLHIDRIVLHDLALGRQQRGDLQAALQLELQRLLSTTDPGSISQTDRHVRSTAPQAISVNNTRDADHLGTGVAQGIYKGIVR